MQQVLIDICRVTTLSILQWRCYIMVDSERVASQNGFCSYKLSIHKKTILCGPAVYFVLTHGDLQQREWTFCCSVVERVEKYSLGGSIGEEIHV